MRSQPPGPAPFRPRPAPAARPRPCPRRPAKLAAPRAAVSPPRSLAPACLDCRHARGREGDVRRVRAFLPSATRRGTHVPGRTPRLSLTVGGGASVFIKLAGHGSQVPGFGCAPGAVTRAELCWGKVAASLHSTRTPPTLRESLGLLPRSQEGPTPTLCQPPDIVPPPGVCTPESPSESCHLQGRA